MEHPIYDDFLKGDWYNFYKRIQKRDQIDLENKDEEKLLNETLTLFDALNYFQIQGLLDEKAWEYVACEIQNFAFNESVWNYMCQFIREYQNRGFPVDIIPFTGFPELLENVPPKFRANPFPCIPDRYKALFKS